MALTLHRQHSPSLAYHKREGRSPGILFLHGFKADKDGTKAHALMHWCHQNNRSFVSFDYTGHGESGGQFVDGTIGQWRQDTKDILTHIIDQPMICVGSSMGGWMGILAALDVPEKVTGIVGIASAPDFTTRLIEERLSDAQKEALSQEGFFLRPSIYGEPYPITKRLIDESHQHLVLHQTIACKIPLYLLHGLQDADVPWTFSVELVEKWLGPAHVTLIKGADHRLQEPHDLAHLLRAVTALTHELDPFA